MNLNSFDNLEKQRKLVQQKLTLLLHAHNCSSQHTNHVCNVPDCLSARNLLAHMTMCMNGRNCTVIDCAPSRRIITHWKKCKKIDCRICSSIRAKTNNNNMNSNMKLGKFDTNQTKINNQQMIDTAFMNTTNLIQEHLQQIDQVNSLKQNLYQQQKAQSTQLASNSVMLQEHKPTEKASTNNLLNTNLQPNSNTIPVDFINFDKKQQNLTRNIVESTTKTKNNNLGTEEKCKLIRQQLVLLLHAQNCNKITGCHVPYCSTMRNLLAHMTMCMDGRNCTVALCSTSRQIIDHWRNCNKSYCPICYPLKAYKSNTNRNMNTSRNEYKNELNEQKMLSTAKSNKIITQNQPHPPQWRQSITIEMRKNLIQTILKTLIPEKDKQKIYLHPRFANLIELAANAEYEIYEKAHNLEEYFYLLAEFIYIIEKEYEKSVPCAINVTTIANVSQSSTTKAKTTITNLKMIHNINNN